MKHFASLAAVIAVAGLLLRGCFWLASDPEPDGANSARFLPSASPAPQPASITSLTPAAQVAVAAPGPFAILKPPVSKPIPPAFQDFSAWVGAFLSNRNAATAARGEALAWKRREALIELIQADPQRALELAVPFAWRDDLPRNVTRHFEQPVDGRGSLTVAVATDFDRAKATVLREAHVGSNTYQAFVYGRRLTQPCKDNIPLHGVAVGNKLALDSKPVRMLEPAEAEARHQRDSTGAPGLCGVCGRPAVLAGDIGGVTAHFCGTGHAQLVNDAWVLAESGDPIAFAPGDETGSAPWSLGPKSLLYMRVNFPDDLTEPNSEASAYAAMDEVNSFYVEGSYNQTAITPTVTPLLTLPQTKGWYSTAGPGALLSDAREAARLAGYDTSNYALDIVSLTSVPEYDWGGLGFVGGKGTWLQSSGAGVTAHELGHNYGLWHGNFWETTNYSAIAYGTNVEYGNSFDTMGAAAAGRNHFNANFKSLLHWLPDAAVQTVTGNGRCRIFPFDTARRVDGCVYAARVRKDFERDYWVEYRERFASNPWLTHGVLLNWSAWAASSGGTDLLDTTPGSPDGKNDAAVVIGRTFSDYPAGVHITPTALGVTGTNRWIEVQIHSGFFPSNRPPKLKLFASPTDAAPGELVHFQGDASDPDGDELAYAWFGTSYDTDDPSVFSTNNLPWTYRTWSTSGTRVIRCLVSDMKGGVASANVVVNVGPPAGFTVSGRVTDPGGRPLEGALIATGPEAPDLRVGYTDSRGCYVIAGILGEVELQAIKYGYSFTNSTWTNPVAPTAHTSNIDFTAIPLPAISIHATNNALPENDPASQLIFLTHSGDTNQDVAVKVVLSGSATLGTDYDLTPPLSAGENTVSIPAGTNVAMIQLQVRNDATAEFTESVSLSLVEEGGLVVAAPGEVTLSIIDDDTPLRPRVSIASLVSRVPEDGMDSATFVVTRLGSVAADLAVFYATGGTATAGADYTNQLGVFVIPAGQAEARLKIPPINDKQIEVDETLSIALLANAAYTLATSTAQATIVSDDVLRLTVYPTAGGPAEPATSGRFTFKREGDLSGNLEIGYAVGGSATPGVDYQALSGRLLIPAGATSADLQLTPIDDSELEGDESVILSVTNAPGCDSDAPASGMLLIRDNEKASVSITAPDSGASEPGDDPGSFVVSRGSVVNGTLTVPMAISGLAVNGVDYVPLDNQVVIPDGVSSVTLDLIPFDDLHLETTEDVQFVLIPGTNYNLGTAMAVVRITDNDESGVPAIGFTAASSRFEENRSPGISVSLSATSSAPVTVEYRVIGGTASSSDFTLPDGTLTLEPGNRAKSIPLVINNDSLAEPDETIRVVLFNPSGASFDGIKLHTYTIADDDTASLSVSATIPAASETGPVPGNFRITRTGSTSSNLLVKFQVTGTAAAPGDYAPIGGSAVIPAGAGFLDLPVLPVDDPTEEFTEGVKLTLLNAPSARIVSPNTATVTIADNDSDSRPIVSIDSIASQFAVEGGGDGLFTITRTGPTATNLTVYFSRGGTATQGSDYTPLTVPIVIPAGQSNTTLPVTAIDDSLIEGEETVVLALTAHESYRTAYPSSATVVVQDNDQSVRVDPSDLIASEPGTDRGEFSFTRFGTTNTPLQVLFTTSGSAVSGSDYLPIGNSVVIPAGSLTAALPVVALDDLLIEGPETLNLQLQPNAAYTIGAADTAGVTIADDEPMLTISATVETVVEGSRDPAVLTVTRYGDPKYEITALLSISGSASYGVDYPPFTTNVLFTCGVMAIDLLIFPTNELVAEGVETVTAALVPHPSYTVLSPSNAMVSIMDAAQNLAPSVTITSPTADTVFLLGTNVNMILEAVVSIADTNVPLNLLWSKVAGPDTLRFGPETNANTTVSFTNRGIYVLRLTADNGALTNYAEVTAIVGAVESLSSNSLHWTFDEGSGTNVLDASGAARNGVISGPFNWSSNGVLGGALELSGAGSEARESPASGFLNGLEAFTLSLWTRSLQTNVDQGLFAANDTGTNTTLELGRRLYPSCGAATNVIEAAIPTDAGVVRYISDTQTVTHDWQHLVLCWSNGLPPALYINGLSDRPHARVSVLEGALVNSPQFLVGRGLAAPPQSWERMLDDVRLFPRALSRWEIGALAALPPTNYGAIVEAGSNITVQVISLAELAGSVVDDGQPDPPGLLTTTWLLVEGPGNVTFTNANALTNSVGFEAVGEYVFRLIADDGQVKTYDDLVVTVIEPTRVDIFTWDPDAAELGPDTGMFSLSRSGDDTVDLPVFLVMGGFASNGVDFIEITNVYVFPAGTSFLEVVITPFLDDRTEGDEPFTLTVVSNASYSIGNPEASVTIHDSPYGAWTVGHFTLEELTDPTLSGAGADFDGDSLVNFAEYAANRDPRTPETNPPVVMTIETDPADGNPYLTIQYPRRLEPTDTTYEVHVSNDLSIWQTGTNYVQELQATDDGNGLTETVKARLTAPFSTATNQFVTVKVWLRVTKPVAKRR